MKMNWGTGIAIVIVIFVLGMVFLALFASRQNYELITDDYYERELDFEEILVKKVRTDSLTQQLQWSIIEGKLLLDFPEEAGDGFSGTLVFYKPSDQSLDREFTFEGADDSLWLEIEALAPGMYRLKADWTAGGKAYFNEGVINIP